MRPELQEIVDEASRVLGTDVTLEDREFNLVAFGSHRLDVDAVRRASILSRRSTREVREWFEGFGITVSERPVRIPADVERGILSRLCFPTRWRGITYGYLWALDEDTGLDSPGVAATTALAERAGIHLAELNHAHVDDAFAVSDLLSPDLDAVRRSMIRIVDRGLVARNVPVVAVVVGAWGPGAGAVSVNLWGLPRQVLADRGHANTTLLVPLRDPADLAPAREVAEFVLALYREEAAGMPDAQLSAGIGEPRTDIADVRGSWLEARLAARVAAVDAASGPPASWAGLGAFRLLAAAPDPDLARAVLDGPVRRLLLAPDRTLAPTVLAYLDRAGNVQETASALHVHRQTLYGRLARAESITGLSLSDGRQALRLHLGLLLAPLLG